LEALSVYCDLVAANLDDFEFKEKRLALEVLVSGALITSAGAGQTG